MLTTCAKKKTVSLHKTQQANTVQLLFTNLIPLQVSILTLCPALPLTRLTNPLGTEEGALQPGSVGSEDPEEPPLEKAQHGGRKFITHGPPKTRGRESGSWRRAPCYCPSP